MAFPSPAPLPGSLVHGRILSETPHTSLSHRSSSICSYEIFCWPQGLPFCRQGFPTIPALPLQKQVTRRPDRADNRAREAGTERGWGSEDAHVTQQRSELSSPTLPPRLCTWSLTWALNSSENLPELKPLLVEGSAPLFPASWPPLPIGSLHI